MKKVDNIQFQLTKNITGLCCINHIQWCPGNVSAVRPSLFPHVPCYKCCCFGRCTPLSPVLRTCACKSVTVRMLQRLQDSPVHACANSSARCELVSSWKVCQSKGSWQHRKLKDVRSIKRVPCNTDHARKVVYTANNNRPRSSSTVQRIQ